jgi:hypothetical protein
MTEIVISGQKFKIQGDEPNAAEQLAIDTFFGARNNADESTGIDILDQEQFYIKPEDVLTEAQKGKYNKDTEGFLASPTFKRIVTEVGLSIAGGIAGAALAPFSGGSSLALTATMATRVARLARPLLNISAGTVGKVGRGTLGASLGGGSGAAIAQTFDPKEDIVREVARGAFQGGFGEVLGFGMAGALGKVYNKVATGKILQVKSSASAKNMIDRQKAFYAALSKIKEAGKLTDDEIKNYKTLKELNKESDLLTKEQLNIIKNPNIAIKEIQRLEEKYGAEFLKQVSEGSLTPALVTDNAVIDTLEGIAESSLFGAGKLMAARSGARLGILGGLDNFVNTVFKGIEIDKIDPAIAGGLIREAVTDSSTLFKNTIRNGYSDLATKASKETEIFIPVNGVMKARPKPGMEINLNWQGKKDILVPGINKIVSKNSPKEYAKQIFETFDSTTPTDVKDIVRMVIGMEDTVSYPALLRQLTNINETKVFSSTGETVKNEILNRLYYLSNTSNIPKSLIADRAALNQLNILGRKTFNTTLMKNVLNQNLGPEQVYKQIVKPGLASNYLKFNEMLESTIKGADGKLVRLFPTDKAETIRHQMRGLFLKDLFNNATKFEDQYTVLRAGPMRKFVENDYKDLIDKGNLLTATQKTELNKLVNAFKFAEGKVQAPGTTSSRGKIFIQLKEAGAISGAAAQIGGAVGGFSGVFDPTSAAIFVFGPVALSKLLANPKITKLLINGIEGQPRNFEQFSRLVSQLGTAMVKEGIVDPDQNLIAQNSIRDNKANYEELLKGKIPAGLDTKPDDYNPGRADPIQVDLRSEVSQRPQRQTAQTATALPNVAPSNLPLTGGGQDQDRLQLAQTLNLFGR